jgi:hypothetical protein
MSSIVGRKRNPAGAHPSKVSLDPAVPGALSGSQRVEPLINAKRVREEFLFGIPLQSIITGEVMSDSVINRIINKSIDLLETTVRVPLFPVQRSIKIDFDRVKYLQGFNQIDLGYGGCISVDEVSIRAADSTAIPSGQGLFPNPPTGGEPYNGTLFYNLPLEWIDMGNAAKGILHLVPLQASIGSTMLGSGPITGAYAPLFAVFTSQYGWIPSFWFVRAQFGISQNGQSVPAFVNEIIGNMVAAEILSMMGPMFFNNSKSIGVDGISQSQSHAGINVFQMRLRELEAKIKNSTDLLRKRFGKGMFMSHV